MITGQVLLFPDLVHYVERTAEQQGKKMGLLFISYFLILGFAQNSKRIKSEVRMYLYHSSC